MVKTVKEEDIVTDVLNTVRSLAEKKGQQLSEEVMGQAEQLSFIRHLSSFLS